MRISFLFTLLFSLCHINSILKVAAQGGCSSSGIFFNNGDDFDNGFVIGEPANQCGSIVPLGDGDRYASDLNTDGNSGPCVLTYNSTQSNPMSTVNASLTVGADVSVTVAIGNQGSGSLGVTFSGNGALEIREFPESASSVLLTSINAGTELSKYADFELEFFIEKDRSLKATLRGDFNEIGVPLAETILESDEAFPNFELMGSHGLLMMENNATIGDVQVFEFETDCYRDEECQPKGHFTFLFKNHGCK